MANTLTMTTSDNQLTYSNDMGGGSKSHDPQFGIQNNNKKANTQGYLIKVQKGNDRVRASLDIADSEENIRDNLLPILNYPAPVDVTFDRNIIMRGSPKGRFEITDYEIKDEIDGDTIEVSLVLVEVLS